MEGQRFPLQACISGWSMLNRQAAVIEDIYFDPRIPHAAYWPTSVKSLVMVPIRAPEPIGAIGAYWARQHRVSAAEVEMLQTPGRLHLGRPGEYPGVCRAGAPGRGAHGATGRGQPAPACGDRRA
ncbi:GAF domain-containing protein [Pseudomonas paeninsulae]|uniref:GAF domain-containing protein n=1 Tax=Pseudomonas paeninsulae TaxID=3110772 RepID=UPI002D7948C9|nr:GAF domain-containing protein [Pseudomonas sp. IT1137]